MGRHCMSPMESPEICLGLPIINLVPILQKEQKPRMKVLRELLPVDLNE